SFDGTTSPAPQQGKCTATPPGGDAVRKTNASGTPVVLPDGRRLDPAGNEWLFTDFPGNFPSGALLVPGTSWLLVVDAGTGALTADAAKSIPLPSGAFPQGIAVSPDGTTLLVGQVTDSHVLVVSVAG